MTVGSEPAVCASINAHVGEVVSVDFSSPKCGNYLATAGHDGRMNIYNERYKNDFALAHTVDASKPLSSVSFAPDAFGPIVACGGHDGYVHITSFRNGRWTTASVSVFASGEVTAVAWAPADIRFESDTTQMMRFVAGGFHTPLALFKSKDGITWTKDTELWPTGSGVAHVTSLAWCPDLGTTVTEFVVTTASSVTVHRAVQPKPEWTATKVEVNGQAIGGASWDSTGTVLGVVVGEAVSYLQRDERGGWAVAKGVEKVTVDGYQL
ncbi:COPII coat complex component Sec13, B (Sec13B) [Carpediemonas membranifera]|uniref:COPII coat complex component Sec13, B (Sec13B) n=1 Tax=Carpediemonas membranifera TaxID=201153 RepID=A0A8J6AZA2_9EUKA|nr:COPII coat complex component Sec13, B (Sec13B) [Carpediemonas membranifera]|eukprot:KAG9389579.1 COPII coat complex component Sec13, B (Sec13B) [Carpediemonas membranifera]